MIWRSKGMNSPILVPHFLLCHTEIIMLPYLPYRILKRIAGNHNFEYTLLRFLTCCRSCVGEEPPVLSVESSTSAHTQARGATPHHTPNHSQNDVNRAAQGSAGGRERGELHTQGNNRDWIVYACGKGRMNMDKTLCAFC
ncbi:hypothetical protein HJG60_011184 [Phyllostomus discolor]|uniref:Uncharacterized protein n=1 Tax=Phyllostomus discolor TaxID=89673 RepID=A0A834E576_9CHIR|nr:hypothetical protein HJG60_011184 [Phyllostomus discolor]